MSTNLSPEHEQTLAEAVARGMFVDTRQALDEAIRLLRGKLEIEAALLAGLKSGESIPGSRLTVAKVQRRMEDSKLTNGQLMEVSVVEVSDRTTGAKREWISGRPSTAHDPVALVEDPATGQRYTAIPGQRFRSADGIEYVITDVRPNQIVIENVSEGTTQTLPLKGPRG